MKEIETLTLAMLTGCPHCALAKIALKKYGIVYDELNWSDDSNDPLFEELGIQTVPVLLVPERGVLTKIVGESAIKEWARTQTASKV
jgi:glutaredoxin